ncbi:hypothetical protein SLE2022_246700 [Rubroshorea leprosula]
MWSRGLDDSILREIPSFQFKREGEDGSIDGCVVCLDEFQEQDMLGFFQIAAMHYSTWIALMHGIRAILPSLRNKQFRFHKGFPLILLLHRSSSPQTRSHSPMVLSLER